VLKFLERSSDFHSSSSQDFTSRLDPFDDLFHLAHLSYPVVPSSFPTEVKVSIDIPDKSLFSPKSLLESDQVLIIVFLIASLLQVEIT
jgi:hypothetical protein